MKSRIFSVALFVSFFFVNGAYAQNKYYLSHFANGNYGDGSFKMTVILFNNTNTDTSALLQLTDDNGLPLTVTFTGSGTASQFNIPLSAGASQILQTDGLGGRTVDTHPIGTVDTHTEGGQLPFIISLVGVHIASLQVT